MADGFTISAEGLAEAEREMKERIKRLQDFTPALKVVAAEIEKRTDDAFQQSRSPLGEIWPTLAPSTQLARAAKLPGASRRSKKTGALTKGAKGKRAEGIAAYQYGGANTFKALIDTARMRNSVRVKVSKKEIEFSAVGYMGPHIVGGKGNRPPKRNPTVFERAGRGFDAIPAVMSYLLRTVGWYIATGQVR